MIFRYLFDDINVYTKTADIAIGNLATTFKDAMNAEVFYQSACIHIEEDWL